MITTDTHMHSIWSPDGHEELADIFSTAQEKQLHYIAITDHMDLEDPDGSEGVSDVNSYIADISSSRRNITHMQLLIGIEAGVNKENLRRTEEKLSSYVFDTIILSVHNLGKVSVAKVPEGSDYDDFLKQYLEEVLYCVETMNQYQILGHLDYPARYLPLTLDSYKKHEALVDSILEVLIKRHKALELNTAKLDMEKHFDIMSWVVEKYVHKGGKMVSVGSDAHRTEAIMRNYDKAEQILKKNDIGKVVVFRNTNTFFEPIAESTAFPL